MSKFIYKEQEDGITYASLNPRYKRILSEKKYEYFLKKSSIPDFYWDIEFENYRGEKSRESLNKLIYFSEKFEDEKFDHVHLYLYGINNSQKTSMACCVLKQAIKKRKECYFVLAGELIDKLMKVQGFTINEEIEAYLTKLKNSDMIVIDEAFDPTKSMMWAKSPELVITAWDIFLRSMVSSRTKILMTSNIPVNVIKERFGESLYHLIDRNFIPLGFYDDYKKIRKENFDNIFKDGI